MFTIIVKQLVPTESTQYITRIQQFKDPMVFRFRTVYLNFGYILKFSIFQSKIENALGSC